MNQNQATYNQSTSTPIAKVQAVGYSGIIVTAILAVTAMLGIHIPEDMVTSAVVGGAAIVSLINFLAGYFKKSKIGEK